MILLLIYAFGVAYASYLMDTSPDTGEGFDPENPNDGFTTNYFNGQIDDVRIYNRVLSATEIKQLLRYVCVVFKGLEVSNPFFYLSIYSYKSLILWLNSH